MVVKFSRSRVSLLFASIWPSSLSERACDLLGRRAWLWILKPMKKAAKLPQMAMTRRTSGKLVTRTSHLICCPNFVKRPGWSTAREVNHPVSIGESSFPVAAVVLLLQLFQRHVVNIHFDFAHSRLLRSLKIQAPAKKIDENVEAAGICQWRNHSALLGKGDQSCWHSKSSENGDPTVEVSDKQSAVATSLENAFLSRRPAVALSSKSAWFYRWRLLFWLEVPRIRPVEMNISLYQVFYLVSSR